MYVMDIDIGMEKLKSGWLHEWLNKSTEESKLKMERGNKLISSFMYDDDVILYNTSFDLLIPVLNEIGKLDTNHKVRVTHTYCFEINGNGTTIYKSFGNDFEMIRHNSNNNILYNTYSAIVEFIEWYNGRLDMKRDRSIDRLLDY